MNKRESQICGKTVSKSKQHLNIHKDATAEEVTNASLNGRKRIRDCLSKESVRKYIKCNQEAKGTTGTCGKLIKNDG